jgi:predicted RNA methylase
MFSFVFTEILVLLIIIGLLSILSWVWPPDSPWAPWWQMPDEVIKKMGQIAKISSSDIIYDLGCGTGKALIYSSKTHKARGVGIEIDPIRFFLAKWNVYKFHQEKSITLLKKNFFHVSLAPATVIFVYLVPAALKRLTPKFLKELRTGTKFLSYIYPMPQELFKGKLELILYDKKNKIYYYRLLAKAKK